jgi:hypothetical protein
MAPLLPRSQTPEDAEVTNDSRDTNAPMVSVMVDKDVDRSVRITLSRAPYGPSMSDTVASDRRQATTSALPAVSSSKVRSQN